MTTYPRSAYKNPFHSLSYYGSAKARGWGSGWPNCQTGKMKTVSGGDIRVTVREEIATMVMHLLEATDRKYNLIGSETGAYNCRPIAGTNVPSNHSWGLAIDINWNHNPMSTTFHSEIPPSVVAMWNDCGWYWGGFYRDRPDCMHFEYIGKPGDVASDTAQAKKYNLGTVGTTSTSKSAETWGANMTDTSKIGTRNIQKWSRGVDVKLVQRYFGLEDDGYFGDKTAEKVKTWQMGLDLQSDGVVKTGYRNGRKLEWEILRSVLKNF